MPQVKAKWCLQLGKLSQESLLLAIKKYGGQCTVIILG